MQGGDILRTVERKAPRVPIIPHPDVRRMLMLQKSHAEGMRALALWVASVQDQVELRAATAPSEDAEATASTTSCCRSSRDTIQRRATSF